MMISHCWIGVGRTGPMVLVGVLLLAATATWASAGRGIEIRPDADGDFVYSDDFQSPRFLMDGFVSGNRPNIWQPGQIRNYGPGGWSLIYRFHGRRVIENVEVRIAQEANGANLGGYNDIHVSHNGLDWVHAAGSGSIEPGGAKWQRGPLTVGNEKAAAVLGGTELWVRFDLRNVSGLPTNTSSFISDLHVAVKVGDESAAGDDPQAALTHQWGRLRAASGWRSLALDATDPVSLRPPYYFEDVDGWLCGPGERGLFGPASQDSFYVRRAQGDPHRLPLSLVAFIQTDGGDEAMMARITVAADRHASRRVNVLWNGQSVGEFDVASYFEKDLTFMVALAPSDGDRNELQIVPEDRSGVHVRQIMIAAGGEAKWVAKPDGAAGGRLKVISAYYMPDPAPPAASQVVEGRNKKYDVGLTLTHLQRMYEEHADFGGLRVVLRNEGDGAVRIGHRMELNGGPIEDHYVDFVKSEWDARGVVWHRVRPRLVKPGACAQVYVRFRRRPAGDAAALTIHLEKGEPVNVTVPYVNPGVEVDYVTVNEDRDTLYVYARQSDDADTGNVIGLTLDGVRLRGEKIYGAEYEGKVALLTAKLDPPMEVGDYHVVGVRTDGGQKIAAQFRVLSWFYPRSSIHVPSQLCEQMHMNLGMWYGRSLEECEKYNIDSTSGDPFGAHERVRFILGPDEPDAHDNRGGGHDRGLGSIGRRLAQSGWQGLIERYAPHAASWIIMNGTTRPLNWSVYGQMADISCFDPYPINFYAGDHAYVRESLLLARRCGTPNRMFGCMEAFGWGGGQGVPQGARGPSPAEYRQNIVQAIGSGMKGLTSWVYVSGAGGWQLDEPGRDEIARVNRLIEHIEDDLLLATPIDLASTDAGEVMTGVASAEGEKSELWSKQRVWAGALLSGPDTIVVAAANHIAASKPDPPQIEPARDVTISVELPSYLRKVAAFEATEDGIAAIACEVDGGTARIKLDEIESGRVFLLRRAK